MATSQSKETTDTLAAVEAAHTLGRRVLAITTRRSPTARKADAVLLTKAGPKIGVAATKTVLTQVVALNLLALQAAGNWDVLPEESPSLWVAGSGWRRRRSKRRWDCSTGGSGRRTSSTGRDVPSF